MKLFLILILLQVYDNSFETWAYSSEFIVSDWSVTAVVEPQPATECKCLQCLCNWEGKCVAGCGHAAKTARIVGNFEYVNLDKCMNEWEHRKIYIPTFLDRIIRICTNDYRNFNAYMIAMFMRGFDTGYFAYQREIKYNGYVYSWWEREDCMFE